MKKVLYYITDVGWGHLTRSKAVISELITQEPQTIVEVYIGARLSKTIHFFQGEDERIKLHVLPFNLAPGWPPNYPFQKKELSALVDEWLSCWEEMVRSIKEHIDGRVCLVISDASPLPIEAAQQIEVPSIFISNFNFFDEYRHLLPEKDLSIMEEAYSKADWVFLLPLESKNSVFKIKERVALVAREHIPQRVQSIRRDLRRRYRPEIIATVSMGGFYTFQKSLIEAMVKASKNCRILWLIPKGWNVPEELLVHFYDREEDFRNIIAASDFFLGKYGYGTASEAVVSKIPMVLIYRPDILEDSMATEDLVMAQAAIRIPWEEPFEIPLEEIFALDFSQLSNRMQNTGARQIVNRLKRRFL